MIFFRQKDDPHSWCISESTNSIKQVRSTSNNSCFKGPFKNQHGKLAKKLLKSEQQHLYHIYWSIRRQLSCEKSLLEICKMLRNFVNILTADDKYFLVNRDNLTQPIQMHLSLKQKYFSEFFTQRWKSSLNFKQFERKDDRYIWCIFEIRDSEKQVTSMANKTRFRGPFEKEHGKRVQKLLKSERQHFDHIYWSLWRQLSCKKVSVRDIKNIKIVC